MMITVQRASGRGYRFPLGRSGLKLALAAMLEVLGAPEADLEVRLCGDAEIAALNREFLGLPGPTNVLSFPADGAGGADLGSLVLSVDAVAREATLYGQDPVEHGLRLLAHGLAHLAGLDHGPEMDALAQAALEAALEGPLASTPPAAL
jgi:probable rRNA maturation factor